MSPLTPEHRKAVRQARDAYRAEWLDKINPPVKRRPLTSVSGAAVLHWSYSPWRTADIAHHQEIQTRITNAAIYVDGRKEAVLRLESFRTVDEMSDVDFLDGMDSIDNWTVDVADALSKGWPAENLLDEPLLVLERVAAVRGANLKEIAEVTRAFLDRECVDALAMISNVAIWPTTRDDIFPKPQIHADDDPATYAADNTAERARTRMLRMLGFDAFPEVTERPGWSFRQTADMTTEPTFGARRIMDDSRMAYYKTLKR